MIIVGAGGLASEIVDFVAEHYNSNDIFMFDNVSTLKNSKLFNKYPILDTFKLVSKHFNQYDNKFVLGIGAPIHRFKLCKQFEEIEGSLTSIIHSTAIIGQHHVNIKSGTIVFPNVCISNNVYIGKGCLIYYNVIITHDCCVGDFVELSPGATLLGNCIIGDYTSIGANATVLPSVKIGRNVTIGSGAVVTKDVADNKTVVGVPARIVR